MTRLGERRYPIEWYSPLVVNDKGKKATTWILEGEDWAAIEPLESTTQESERSSGDLRTEQQFKIETRFDSRVRPKWRIAFEEGMRTLELNAVAANEVEDRMTMTGTEVLNG